MKEYVDKSEVVAEIERLQNDEFLCDSYDIATGFQSALRMVQEFIDTLEVKEVDLEEELDEWMKYGPHTNYPWCTIPDAIKITAEHFFELGLKTKGE